MHPTPFRLLAGRSATFAAMLMVVSTSSAQSERVRGGAQTAGSAVAQGASLVGGALPGGAVLSSAVASLTPVGGSGGGGGGSVTSAVGEDGAFSFKDLKPGAYELRISFPAGPRQTTDTSSTRQTPKTDFGSVMKPGDDKSPASRTRHEAAMGSVRNIKAHTQEQPAGAAKSKHDTVKNSIGNVRAHEEEQATGGVRVAVGDVKGDGHAESAQAGGAGAAASAAYAKENLNSGMPNRISMNVTTPRRNFAIDAGGAPVVVEVGGDGTFAARASVQQAQQGAEPATSGRPDREPPPPPRPAGG